MNDVLFKIYNLKQTVFTTDEIGLLFPDISPVNLNRRLSYFIKKGQLKNIRKGFYAKEDYNILEFANKIRKPSYISFQTVLKDEGVVFQETGTIFLASYSSRKIKFKNLIFSYHKLPDFVLTEEKGIVYEDFVYKATKERAFLDTIFVFKEFYFDNIMTIDWDIVNDMELIYDSKALNKRVNKYYKTYNEQKI